jgi:hypothetical protein
MTENKSKTISRLGSIKKSTGLETSMGDYTIAPVNMFDF